ncbi:hypothetical protein CIK05_01825 [Bdellovibrio sp. qaytius]|nr:hypothetical protein CIK05_01825 [Bdellovibrio sp. qaytius]
MLHINSNLALDSLIADFREICPHRSSVLFREFLPVGYRLTTLSSVPAEYREIVIQAKIRLGMLITLYDDLADHPDYLNAALLKKLYRLNIDEDYVLTLSLSLENKIFQLARRLFSELRELLSGLPNFDQLKAILEFDIEQFYCCNRLSSLATETPGVLNLVESQTLGPHNMGIVAAGTIDLMSVSDLNVREIAICREIFILGQRMGRISNVVYTFEREQLEGDQTNEIFVQQRLFGGTHQTIKDQLLQELEDCYLGIKKFCASAFSSAQYAQGFLDLHDLHARLERQI